MNKFLLIGLIGQVAFAANSSEFYSKKLPRAWSSSVKYNKVDEWSKRDQTDPLNQFYEGIFRTRIDHFRPQNQQRVDFRYHANANHYNEDSGPLYIYLKEAYDYTTRWIEEGLMVDIARETGAALLTFDHRFYGSNRPLDSASFENLELLTIEQSLADIAEFIRFVRQYVGNGQYSTVVLYGSGYGAMLAVYARSRYPNFVHGAWSSSGVLESSVYSFGPYYLFEYTFTSIYDAGFCSGLVRSTYEQIENLVATGQGEYLAESLNLCHPVDTVSSADVASLYENTIRAVFYYLNEYHLPGLQNFCLDMAAIPGDPLNSFANWLRYVYGDEECFDSSYATLVERYSNVEWDEYGTNSGRRQSYYLQCTQIGSLLVTDSRTWLPGTVDLDYHLQKCEDLFGRAFNISDLSEAFNALRTEYDQASTNVIYTNGNLDPLRFFGRTYVTIGTGIVINIDNAMKSADLTSISGSDPANILAAKTTIINTITSWSNGTVRSN